MHINKWSALCFPQAEPSLLAGHPGFDDFSAAHFHVKTWPVQTLSKVSLMMSSVGKRCVFCFWFGINICCKNLSASENYGKSFEDVTSLINNTFIRSEFGIAIGPENSGKVGHVFIKSPDSKFTICFMYSSGVSTNIEIQCCVPNALARRWSWWPKCLEVTPLGSLSPMILERVSPQRTCPSPPSRWSLTTLKIPVCCWSAAAK